MRQGGVPGTTPPLRNESSHDSCNDTTPNSGIDQRGGRA